MPGVLSYRISLRYGSRSLCRGFPQCPIRKALSTKSILRHHLFETYCAQSARKSMESELCLKLLLISNGRISPRRLDFTEFLDLGSSVAWVLAMQLGRIRCRSSCQEQQVALLHEVPRAKPRQRPPHDERTCLSRAPEIAKSHFADLQLRQVCAHTPAPANSGK